MRALVINLDRSSARLSFIAEQFKNLGLTFERVPAVDGKSMPLAEWKQHAAKRFDGHEWGASEIGCFLSHRLCWRLIAEGREDYVAIFEDDVYLDAEVRHLLLTDVWIPAGTDVVKLEASSMEHYQGAPQNAGIKHRLYRSGAPWAGSAAYVISRDLATRIANMDVFNCVVDQFLFDSYKEGHRFKSLEVRPGICLQTQHITDKMQELESTIALDRAAQELAASKIKRGLAEKVIRELMRPFRRTYAKLLKKYRTWQAMPLDIPARPSTSSVSVFHGNTETL